MKIELSSGFLLDASHFWLDKNCNVAELLTSHTLSLYYSWERIKKLRQTYRIPGQEGLNEVRFPLLPYQHRRKPGLLAWIKEWGEKTAENYENLLVIGIGGSSLGGRMIIDALTPTHYNLRSSEKRNHRPRIFFLGDNLDPAQLQGVMEIISPDNTALLAISKSGTTTEPLSTLMVLAHWMGESYLQHLTAVTDPYTGALRQLAREKDIEAFPIDPAVGGRWSVLDTAGLLVAAAAGIDTDALLAGARFMDKVMDRRGWRQNPALLYAGLVHSAHHQGLDEGVLMPYSNRLYSLALWYVQLLAESLGKGHNRDGRKVNTGRTPLPALGTTDMHAQTQQHQEGPRNKVITFIEVADHGASFQIPPVSTLPPQIGENLAGKRMEEILSAALDANIRALSDDFRPSIKIKIPHLGPFDLGQLLYFFEMTVAIEGELLNVDAYNQPGVEAYKTYLKEWLRS